MIASTEFQPRDEHVKILYFDCFAGISGDMVLGALAGAGADREAIAAALDGLPVSGFELVWEQVNRNGIEAVRAVVTTAEDHHHRGLGAVLEIIEKGNIAVGIKKTASAIFRNLAEAEAAVHGKSVDEIHFHEVGALDAIVDIVGAAAALENLGAKLIIGSPVRTGFGTVRCAHGDYPIPAPGTAALLRNGGIPSYAGEVEGEWTTPTGAAILSAVCSRYQSMPRMDIAKIGYGAGGRTHPELPNLLRVFVGESEEGAATEVVVMETEIDDTNPQLIGHLHSLLPAAGALDWYTTPVQMKKKPAWHAADGDLRAGEAARAGGPALPRDDNHRLPLLHRCTRGTRTRDHQDCHPARRRRRQGRQARGQGGQCHAGVRGPAPHRGGHRATDQTGQRPGNPHLA